jgi:hypothetical protein
VRDDAEHALDDHELSTMMHLVLFETEDHLEAILLPATGCLTSWTFVTDRLANEAR